jgi:hypothetical protein
MVERELNSPQDFIPSIKATFKRISRQLIEHLFEGWMDPVERWNAFQGCYFSED